MVLGNSEEYHRVLQKILRQKGHGGPSIRISFLQCLYSVEIIDILKISLNCSPPSTSMVALVDHHEIQAR